MFENSLTLVILGAIAAVLVLVPFVAIIAFRNFYVVPRADEALMKTGGSSPTVSTGALWVIPLVHNVTRVSLRAVRIPIQRTGENALPTANKIMAEIMGELIVRVSPDDTSHIILAAQALGTNREEAGKDMSDMIKEQVDSLVTDALRTAAFKKTFQELNAGKKEFADEVTQLLAEDLAKLGLTLTAVTIPHLKQGEFTADKGDVFAAEGQRNVAETVAKNRQETNLINRNAEVEIQRQDLEARRRALELDLDKARLEAEQSRARAEYEATKATETKKAVLAQEQERSVAEAEQHKVVKTAQIQQEQEVATAKITQEQTLAVQRADAAAQQKVAEEAGQQRKLEAEIGREKAVEAATIAKEQAIRVADEQRLQAVAEAEIAKQVAIAARKTEEADARGKQATAEAEQQRAEQGIVTVRAEAEADRQKRVVIIQAEEEATKQKVAADRDAYVMTRNAEAERDTAMKRAEAAKAVAVGQADAARASASGAAESAVLAAQGEANARTTRATAELEASEKEAKARALLSEATLAEGRAVAESERLLQAARNTTSRETMLQTVALEAIRQSPALMREFMAPIAKVSDVKVLQINGLGGGGGRWQRARHHPRLWPRDVRRLAAGARGGRRAAQQPGCAGSCWHVGHGGARGVEGDGRGGAGRERGGVVGAGEASDYRGLPPRRNVRFSPSPSGRRWRRPRRRMRAPRGC